MNGSSILRFKELLEKSSFFLEKAWIVILLLVLLQPQTTREGRKSKEISSKEFQQIKKVEKIFGSKI